MDDPFKRKYFLLNRDEFKQALRNSVRGGFIRPTASDYYNKSEEWLMRVYYKHVVRNMESKYGSYVHEYTEYMSGSYTEHLMLKIRYTVRGIIEQNPIAVNSIYTRTMPFVMGKPKELIENADIRLSTRSVEYRMLLRNGEFWPMVIDGRSCTELTEILDYFESKDSKLPVDVTRFSVEQATKAAKEWHIKEQERVYLGLRAVAKISTQPKIEANPEKILEVDGWVVHLLKSLDEYREEGQVQHHCVEAYWRGASIGKCVILSLRKEDVRWTIELVRHSEWKYAEGSVLNEVEFSESVWTIRQIRGVCNEPAPVDIHLLLKGIMIEKRVVDTINNYVEALKHEHSLSR